MFKRKKPTDHQDRHLSISVINEDMFGSENGLPKDESESFVFTSAIEKCFKNNRRDGYNKYKYIIGDKGVGKTAFFDYLDRSYQSDDTYTCALSLDVDIGVEEYLNNSESKSFLSARLLHRCIYGLFHQLFGVEEFYFIQILTENDIFIQGINEHKRTETEFSLQLSFMPLVTFGTKFKAGSADELLFHNTQQDYFVRSIEILCSFSRHFRKRIMIIIDGIDDFTDAARRNGGQYNEKKFLADILDTVKTVNQFSKEWIDCKIFVRTDLFSLDYFGSNRDKARSAMLKLKFESEELLEMIGRKLLMKNELSGFYIENAKLAQENEHRQKKFRLSKADYINAVNYYFPSSLGTTKNGKNELLFKEWLNKKLANCAGEINPRVLIRFIACVGERQREIYNELGFTRLIAENDCCPLFFEYVFHEVLDSIRKYEYDRIKSILNPEEIAVFDVILYSCHKGNFDTNILAKHLFSFDIANLNKLLSLNVIKRNGLTFYSLEKLLVGFKPSGHVVSIESKTDTSLRF